MEILITIKIETLISPEKTLMQSWTEKMNNWIKEDEENIGVNHMSQ